MLHTILLIIDMFSAACIIGLVLVQRGKGADAGAGFGAGASGTVFGARGATTALSRATAILAGIFMVTSLALAYTGARSAAAPKTLLDQLAEQQTTQESSAPGAAAPAGAPTGAPVVTIPASDAPATAVGAAPAPVVPPAK